MIPKDSSSSDIPQGKAMLSPIKPFLQRMIFILNIEKKSYRNCKGWGLFVVLYHWLSAFGQNGLLRKIISFLYKLEMQSSKNLWNAEFYCAYIYTLADIH